MKIMSVLFVLAFTVNSFAIEFITEQEVQQTLSADKVIEISRYSVQEIEENDCDDHSLMSRSGRAYVVKKDNKSYLFTTPSGLAGLKECREL